MLAYCFDVGSSSLKFAAYGLTGDRESLLLSAEYSGDEARALPDQIESALADAAGAKAGQPGAIGHRVVFGGERYAQPVIVGDRVLADLESFVRYDPLHLEPQLMAVRVLSQRFREIPQVLCFDTMFAHGMPEVARRFALPRSLGSDLRRYGFHGLSYEYVLSALEEAGRGKAIIAHLGAGASMCALVDGKPLDTTMGFSPLGGLVMGTRPGDLDPGVLLHLVQAGWNADELGQLLYERSGLLAVSETTSDVRALLEAAATDARAALAIELFVYHARKHLGAMIASIGGVDLLVFTGGIGERSSQIRAGICSAFGFAGIELDRGRNDRDDAVISTGSSKASVRVIQTNENLMVARHVRSTASEAVG